METRRITVVTTKSQKRSVIMSSATTLGELKRDLRENHIDYTGMAFYEGLSKTELKDDASLLPHDIPLKGQTTNELVFMLTNTEKKIKSGAGEMSRKEIYDAIKEKNLQKECEKRFGQHFTRCKTSDLLSLINEEPKKVEPKEPAKPQVKEPVEKEGLRIPACNCVEAISKLVDILYDNDCLSSDESQCIKDILNGKESIEESSIKSPYSGKEIDDMFDFVK